MSRLRSPVAVTISVDTGAAAGSTGTLLLDPANILIAVGGLAPLTGVDEVTDSSAGPGCDGTTCTVDPAALNAAVATVAAPLVAGVRRSWRWASPTTPR